MPEIYSVDECPQGSAEWFEIRKGIPTASEFHKVMAKAGPRGGTSHKEYVQRMKYMRILAGEIITDEPHESEWGGNRHTERGKENEDAARALYAMVNASEPRQVGFIRNGNCGCSPDSLIGDDGGLELKDALPHVQIERLDDGTLPSEHKWQVVGNLLVSERDWWDFMSRCRGLPPFIVRIDRDTELVVGKETKRVSVLLTELRAGIDRFNAELELMVKRIEAMW